MNGRVKQLAVSFASYAKGSVGGGGEGWDVKEGGGIPSLLNTGGSHNYDKEPHSSRFDS